MKHLFILFVLLVTLASCNRQDENVKWEYQVVTLDGGYSLAEYAEKTSKKLVGIQGREAARTINFGSPVEELNKFGQDGWELVTTYTTIETEFPNFGELGYHTGIKSNTHTEKVVFVLKRRKSNQD